MRIGFFLGVVALLTSTASISAAKKPLESSNELPNRSARFQPDAANVDIFADLLVWCAQESGADNWAVVIATSGSKTSCDIKETRFNWNAGFRAGLGYGMRHDQWDTQLYYTRFCTQGNEHVSANPDTVFSPFLGNFFVNNSTGAGLSGIVYEKASVRWTVHFNMFDWELGRGFWVSKALSLRPFIGLKGGWIYQSIHSKWQNPHVSASQLFNTGTENLKNDFWGVGPCGGLSMKWNLIACPCQCFSLFGDFSGALMYGHWIFEDVYKNDINQEIVIKTSHLKSAATMVRTLMGLGWDTNFSQDRFHFSVKLGYEMQFWLDQLQFYSFDAGRLSNVLTLQGGTLEFRFDF